MPHTIFSTDEIAILADFTQAACGIKYRVLGRDKEDEWLPSPFQVADFSHDPDDALDGVNRWLDTDAC